MNKILFIAAAVVLLAAASTTNVNATGKSTCQVVYGGGEVCPPNSSFTIDKLVQSPTKGGQFVDNLTIKDTQFKTDQDVVFQIKVKNTGDVKIDRIEIVDTLPSEVTFSAGPGTYNADTNTLTIITEGLESGKEAIYHITAKVQNNRTIECATNSVRATSSDGSVGEDTATFCMAEGKVKIQEKPVIEKIPATGPAETGAILFSLPALGAAGFYIRKKTGF